MDRCGVELALPRDAVMASGSMARGEGRAGARFVKSGDLLSPDVAVAFEHRDEAGRVLLQELGDAASCTEFE